MNFAELLQSAKARHKGATMGLLKRYDPMLMKSAVLNGVFDEELYQELRIVLLGCIRTFTI